MFLVLALISCTPKGFSDNSASLELPADDLLNGFGFNGPLDEAALTPPEVASFTKNEFEGRLELLGENESKNMQMLRGELGEEFSYLPEFDFTILNPGTTWDYHHRAPDLEYYS